MQPFPLSAVAFDGGVVAEAGHGMTSKPMNDVTGIKFGNYLSFAFVLCTTLNLPFIRRNGISKYLYDSEAIPIVRVDIDIKITMDATSFCINSAS